MGFTEMMLCSPEPVLACGTASAPLPRLLKSQAANHPTQQSCAVSRGLLHIYCTKEHVLIASNIISEAPRPPPDSRLRLGSECGRVTDKLPPLQWETGTGRRGEAPDAPRMDAPRVGLQGRGSHQGEGKEAPISRTKLPAGLPFPPPQLQPMRSSGIPAMKSSWDRSQA